MRKPKEPPHGMLAALFTLTVFIILFITATVVGAATYVLSKFGWLDVPSREIFLLMIALASIAVGTVVSLFVGRLPVKPASDLIYGMNALASGNYETRLSLPVPGIGKDLEESFNIMAEELQNTEMLRSDFVNNFSHEFKTPLVSMQGFARLLQREDLPEEKRREYLAILAAESARLADMATKVLEVTKLENQSILTGVSRFNLSEQLRQCILLLEKRWTDKHLQVSAEFEEYTISGNPEMLRQVWINLLDNAVKYCPDGGRLGVTIEQEPDSLCVAVRNDGEEIPAEERTRIFRKFYQCDSSHTAQGNGIGLAIVARIVELHEGTVRVNYENGQTVFRVMLPVN